MVAPEINLSITEDHHILIISRCRLNSVIGASKLYITVMLFSHLTAVSEIPRTGRLSLSEVYHESLTHYHCSTMIMSGFNCPCNDNLVVVVVVVV